MNHLADLSVEILLDHLDGTRCRYLISSSISGDARRLLWKKKDLQGRLAKVDLLAWDGRPWTTITEKGRAKLAEILGNCADHLKRSGLAGAGREDVERAFAERFGPMDKPQEDAHISGETSTPENAP